LHELQESGQFDAAHQQAVLARLVGTTSLSDLAESTLLIEAIPERLPLKHALYAQLETLIADDAIIASNTSGLPPDSLAAGMVHPQRLLSPTSGTRRTLFRWWKWCPAAPRERNSPPW
jgi:3-hydroxybutyryl-CoA dehydrogenase